MITQRKWMFGPVVLLVCMFVLTGINVYIYTLHKQLKASCASEKKYKEEIIKRKNERLEMQQV